MIIDFHCHITTPGSKLPEPDGEYYRSFGPLPPAAKMMASWTQDAVDSMAERWRTAGALKAYRNMGPLIYTEMSRRMISSDASSLLGEMAGNGVSKAVIVAMDPFVPTDEILQACARVQGLLIPFGSVDNSLPDYLDRFSHLLEQPIAGIKFHSDLQELPIDSPKLFAMMDLLAASPRRQLPVYLHTGNFPIYRPADSPWEKALPTLLDRFPELTFVCGHAGWDAPRAALRAALNHPNLYLETSWQPPRLIRRLCDKLGPERLLLGSDFPLFSQARAIKNARTALTEEEFTLVSGANAMRVMGLH